MNFSLLLVVLLSFVAIGSHSANALKCFKCRNEDDCSGYYDFKSDSKDKNDKFIEQDCTSNYTPACLYEINEESVVRQRGCAPTGVTSRVPFCSNRFRDVLICYCMEDWCNGIDSAGTAVNVAKEHFRRQKSEDDSKEKPTTSGAGVATLSAFWLALVMIANSIWVR